LTAWLGHNVDVLDLARRRGNWNAVFTHAFEVKFDGFADLCFRLRNGRARRDTARKIRNVRGIIALRFFDDYSVAHW